LKEQSCKTTQSLKFSKMIFYTSDGSIYVFKETGIDFPSIVN